MYITVDEGFNVDFNTANTITGCNVCALDHETEKCFIFDNLIHIEDAKVLPRALLTLPPNLKVETLTDGTKAVIATECFTKGTQFGPYQAEKFYSLNPFDHFPIKIFGDSENILPESYINSRNEEKCNWMCYVPPANNFEEQNLICYQIKLDIFYSVIREINPGDQLKVWYSTYYAAKIGSKVYNPKKDEEVEPDDHEKILEVAQKLPPIKFGAKEKQNWCCKMCGYNETIVVKFARHLQKHYLKMLKNLYVCNICNAGFSTEKALKKHRKFVHTVIAEHKPSDIDCFVTNNSEESKTDLMEPFPIDHLLSVTLTESDQLLTLDQLSLTNTGIYNDLSDAETLRAILCDDNTKASKTAQEKSIADFSLEFVESNDTVQKLQAPYFCDICNKQFHHLHNLFRHLKKHTGEYTCVQCLVVFSRRENYLRHPCFSDSIFKKFNCTYCSKSFYQKKYLKRHITRHLENYICYTCGKQYKTKPEKDNHNCSAISKTQKKKFPCSQCNKIFLLKVYLQRHLKTCHEEKIKKHKEQSLICEICANTYRSPQALRMHKTKHSEPKYECIVCDKKFYRTDTYNNHLLSHGTYREICDICKKQFRSKNSLKEHQLIHTASRYTCEFCGKTYIRKSSLKIHQQRIHLDNPVDCEKCDKTFKNEFLLTEHRKIVHSSTLHKCTSCDQTFTLHWLLNRHIRKYHTNIMYACQYCSKTFKITYSLRQHLRKRHTEHKNEWDKPEALIKCAFEKCNTNNSEKNNASNNNKVMFSILEVDQNLGQSVFILKNSAIETSSNVETIRGTETIEDKEVLLTAPEKYDNLEQDSCVLESVGFENSELLQPTKLSEPNENIQATSKELLSNAETVPTNENMEQDSIGFENATSLQPKKSDSFLLSKTESVPIISNSKSIENTNVLRVPETEQTATSAISNVPPLLLSVADTDQQITLGKNAYILEDGTIVEPQEQGNLVIYIMKQ